MLNELEKAHIYIEQLHTRNLMLKQRVDEMWQQIDDLRQTNTQIEELVLQLIGNQAEQVAVN